MLSVKKHEAILEAKADGLSEGQIVQLVGVSRGTVAKYMGIQKVHSEPRVYKTCRPHVCPGCRNRIVLRPCMICDSRRLK